MWVMTTIGFFSVIESFDDPNVMVVRARCEEDIRALVELIPGSEPVVGAGTDYPWRIRVSRRDWADTLHALAMDIDYHNVKGSITSVKHARAYSEVWGVLLQLEDDVGPPWPSVWGR